ncbi:GLPGLI family protein [Porphyromonas pogonae]|uniref:GLPGLI family protein n=1 Tax=Porphyromonas pogonae TaxID=867595 RepID=UPI002E78133C|nr:GLPGLI family protein [Porphyromonas pogonae]
MNKHILFIALLGLSVSCLYAQQPKIQGAGNMSLDPAKVSILDHAKYRVYYDMKRQPDAQSDHKISGLCMLQVGDSVNKFWDYNQYRRDSIYDVGVTEKKSVLELMPIMQDKALRNRFSPIVFLNRTSNLTNVYISIGLNDYTYSEKTPTQQWTLAPGDSIIAGYKCKKATTAFRGRDYVAWYTEEVELPFGPYLFGGLPGLIFKLTDTHGHYDFTLAGLEVIKGNDPIYMSDGKWKSVTRQDAMKAEKNYCADPVKSLIARGVIIDKETQASVPPKPYNPIELQ